MRRFPLKYCNLYDHEYSCHSQQTIHLPEVVKADLFM